MSRRLIALRSLLGEHPLSDQLTLLQVWLGTTILRFTPAFLSVRTVKRSLLPGFIVRSGDVVTFLGRDGAFNLVGDGDFALLGEAGTGFAFGGGESGFSFFAGGGDWSTLDRLAAGW